MSEDDWDRLQYYSQKVKFFKATDTDLDRQVHPSTYFRIAQLQSSALFPSLRHLHYNLSHASISDSHIFFFQSPLLDSLEFVNIKGFENTIVGPFLASLSSQVLSRIVLRSGQLPMDILKNSIAHFEQLRSLELSDAVLISDCSLWVDLGTLPCLESFTFVASDPASYPVHPPESQSGDPNYFDALENLCVTSSFPFIQDLLGFIDSPCLKSIKVYPNIYRNHDELNEDPFTPSMTIIASKWSQSLTDLVIGTRRISHRSPISKCLMLLTDFYNMQTFCLIGWKLENADDDVRRLVTSWPKLTTLNLNRTAISLPTLRIIAENCPDLRSLEIPLNAATIPPFDASIVRLSHNLEFLVVGAVRGSKSGPDLRIQVTRHLDLIFPYLKSIKVEDENWVEIEGLIKLCQDVRRL